MIQIVTTDQLLSWKDTMQALGVSSPTLYAILERGELEPAKTQQIGKQQRKFFREGDVTALRRKREGAQDSDIVLGGAASS